MADGIERKAGDHVVDHIPSEAPQRRVAVIEPIFISSHEITRVQFRKFVAETGHKTDAEKDGKGGMGYIDNKWVQDPKFTWDGDLGYTQTDEHPVVNVTWNDAIAFCRWLSQKEGVMYRLPLRSFTTLQLTRRP